MFLDKSSQCLPTRSILLTGRSLRKSLAIDSIFFPRSCECIPGRGLICIAGEFLILQGCFSFTCDLLCLLKFTLVLNPLLQSSPTYGFSLAQDLSSSQRYITSEIDF